MNKLFLLRKMLINSSIGISAIRMQGNGIAEPIRKRLYEIFAFDNFFDTLKAPLASNFEDYLNKLTNDIVGTVGESKNGKPPGLVKWGTARKCINLTLRATVYNGYIWKAFNLDETDFTNKGIVNRLEIPLDNHVAEGIKNDCLDLNIPFDNIKYSSFSIIGLNTKDENESSYYQGRAMEIANHRQVCRIDLDLCYWRKQTNCWETIPYSIGSKITT